jgi:hypothetical protein
MIDGPRASEPQGWSAYDGNAPSRNLATAKREFGREQTPPFATWLRTPCERSARKENTLREVAAHRTGGSASEPLGQRRLQPGPAPILRDSGFVC